jgi:hypothetical protein
MLFALWNFDQAATEPPAAPRGCCHIATNLPANETPSLSSEVAHRVLSDLGHLLSLNLTPATVYPKIQNMERFFLLFSRQISPKVSTARCSPFLISFSFPPLDFKLVSSFVRFYVHPKQRVTNDTLAIEYVLWTLILIGT